MAILDFRLNQIFVVIDLSKVFFKFHTGVKLRLCLTEWPIEKNQFKTKLAIKASLLNGTTEKAVKHFKHKFCDVENWALFENSRK